MDPMTGIIIAIVVGVIVVCFFIVFISRMSKKIKPLIQRWTPPVNLRCIVRKRTDSSNGLKGEGWTPT